MQTPEPDCLSRPSWTSLSLLLTAGGPLEMETLWIPVLFLACLSGASAQEDLTRKAFVFPKETSEAYVLLQPSPEKPLENFTICLRSYTELTRPYGLFSYATQSQDNEILIFKPKPGEYRVFVGGEYVSFKVPEGPLDWEHVCFGWESFTGTAEFWLNGKPWPRKGLKKGYVVGEKAFILLGQEQDHYGGAADSYNSFSGELADVYMWTFVLSPYKMRSAYQDLQLPRCALGWRNLRYEIKGEVVVKPRLR
ncbi:mucosal pentraxin-like isoform X1 [Hemicordylus capensis]|uniref:mucosal pentraxin-like isoform X1 n=1 Tax=Hemicordylus capensis TaxID=884348 RepID=UPI0023039EDF|nr:mucosal pentraxin-like isoform X1 [Hemicordylus capensis]